MTSHPDKIALVTGAATRIGAAIARRLAGEGFAVVIHHRSKPDTAEALAADIRRSGAQVATLQSDLADRAERARTIPDAAAHFGPLTLLVNNASTYQRDAARDLDETLWDQHFAIHAEAPAFLARDFAAQLPPDLRGNIINIIDGRVLDLSPAYFSYTLSKSVLWTMTRTLAQSLAPNIRVNAIGPGPSVAPPGVTPEAQAKRHAELPLGTAADGEGIADGVMAILSLPTLTGQMLALDGGEHLEWQSRRGTTPRRK